MEREKEWQVNRIEQPTSRPEISESTSSKSVTSNRAQNEIAYMKLHHNSPDRGWGGLKSRTFTRSSAVKMEGIGEWMNGWMDTCPDSTGTGLLQTLFFYNEACTDEEARGESEDQAFYVVGGHALAPAWTRRTRHPHANRNPNCFGFHTPSGGRRRRSYTDLATWGLKIRINQLLSLGRFFFFPGYSCHKGFSFSGSEMLRDCNFIRMCITEREREKREYDRR